jgi:hypothetical protein
MKVRLTKKYAERLDDVDLSGRNVGDLLDLPQPEARLLVAEEWAIPERRTHHDPTRFRRRANDYVPEDRASR